MGSPGWGRSGGVAGAGARWGAAWDSRHVGSARGHRVWVAGGLAWGGHPESCPTATGGGAQDATQSWRRGRSQVLPGFVPQSRRGAALPASCDAWAPVWVVPSLLGRPRPARLGGSSKPASRSAGGTNARRTRTSATPGRVPPALNFRPFRTQRPILPSQKERRPRPQAKTARPRMRSPTRNTAEAAPSAASSQSRAPKPSNGNDVCMIDIVLVLPLLFPLLFPLPLPLLLLLHILDILTPSSSSVSSSAAASASVSCSSASLVASGFRFRALCCRFRALRCAKGRFPPLRMVDVGSANPQRFQSCQRPVPTKSTQACPGVGRQAGAETPRNAEEANERIDNIRRKAGGNGNSSRPR